MRSRNLWAVALIFGAASTIAGQTAHAQAPSSERFVMLLLTKESREINSVTKALNTRDNDIAKLNAATNPRQIRKLENMLSRLHGQILSMTTRLITLSGQVYTNAISLIPSNPTLVSKALSNLVVVQHLSLRDGLGIQPATPTK
jgi:hypothetical protein